MPLTRFPRLALPLLLVGTCALAQIDSAPQPIDMEPTRAYDDDGYDDTVEPEPDPEPASSIRDEQVRDEQVRDEQVRDERNVAPSRRPASPELTSPRSAPTPPPVVAPAPVGAPRSASTQPAAQNDVARETPKELAEAATPRAPPRPIIVPTAGDAELQAVFARWRKAVVDLDPKGAEEAERELVTLKEDLGIRGLDSFAFAFARAADAKAQANDAAAAVALATAAVELSPDLPATHLALARAHYASDKGAVGEYVDAVRNAVAAVLRDPRYLRPALADVLTSLMLALLATAAAVVLVLFIRRARYFFHDFHHLFPRAAARWQSAAIALVLLSLPFVFRLGLAPILLVLFGAVSLYLSSRERFVAGALIALLGVLPLVGGVAVDRTAFAGTAAEDLLQLEQGGLAAAPAAERVRKRVQAKQAQFPELFALARYDLRRGRLEDAIAHFKTAAAQRTNDARVLTNLANAVMAQGDSDSAADIFKSAAQADPSLAAPLYNVSRLYNRRAATVPDEQVGAENDRAYTALTTAQKIDPQLLYRKDPPEDRLVHNRLLISPALSSSELVSLARSPMAGERVSAQLGLLMLGTASQPLLYVYPAALAALLVMFGFSASRLQSAKACDKCGRAVCRRCDPELGLGSQLCNQCVNVFARRAAVAAPVRVRKQMEVDRYQGRMDRISYAFGMVLSGAGHVFSGLTVRGSVYTFLFLFLVFNAFFRMGVLRPPYGVFPVALRLVPIGIVFVLLYLLTLRGLFKRETE